MNNRHEFRAASTVFLVVGVILASCAASVAAAELQPATLKGWTTYIETTERRISSELKSGKGFLALDFQAGSEGALERQAALAGEIPVKRMETVDQLGEKLVVLGGMTHHWRGTVFIPGGDIEEILSRTTNPTAADTRQEDVLQANVLERGPDFLRIYLKLQRSKIITVVYNTEHTVQVHRYGKTRASSTSVATRIAELDNPNTAREREKPDGQDRGLLWRMNSYWRYQEVLGGVMVECETITLSRAVPSWLETVIRPLIDSTARESMERTLSSMRDRMAHARPSAGRDLQIAISLAKPTWRGSGRQ